VCRPSPGGHRNKGEGVYLVNWIRKGGEVRSLERGIKAVSSLLGEERHLVIAAINGAHPPLRKTPRLGEGGGGLQEGQKREGERKTRGGAVADTSGGIPV